MLLFNLTKDDNKLVNSAVLTNNKTSGDREASSPPPELEASTFPYKSGSPIRTMLMGNPKDITVLKHSNQ
jgi:myosin-crossreactive antigen